MADPLAPLPSTTSTISSSPPATRPVPVYQTSSKVRINEILEAGRRRSIALHEAHQSLPMSASPLLSPRQTPPPPEHDEIAGDALESSADEHTAIVRRDNGRLADYQSTSTSVRSRTSHSAARSGRSGRRANPQAEHPGSENELPWWKRQVEKLGSVELENKGSVARDHLALERTFLAWLRTSLAFASIGIAITQLFRLNTSISNDPSDPGDDPYLPLRQMGKPLGATFLSISIMVLFVGFHRYFESQHWIIRGKFPASRGSIASVAAVAFALMVTSLVVVLVVEPSATAKRR